jgi:hypothetical protein
VLPDGDGLPPDLAALAPAPVADGRAGKAGQQRADQTQDQAPAIPVKAKRVQKLALLAPAHDSTGSPSESAGNPGRGDPQSLPQVTTAPRNAAAGDKNSKSLKNIYVKQTNVPPKDANSKHKSGPKLSRTEIQRLKIGPIDSIEERSDEESHKDDSQSFRNHNIRREVDDVSLSETLESKNLKRDKTADNNPYAKPRQDPDSLINHERKTSKENSSGMSNIKSINVVKTKVDFKGRGDLTSENGQKSLKSDVSTRPILKLPDHIKQNSIKNPLTEADIEAAILARWPAGGFQGDDGTDGGSSRSTPADTGRSFRPSPPQQAQGSMRGLGESLSLVVKPLHKPTYKADSKPEEVIKSSLSKDKAYSNPFSNETLEIDFDSLQKLIESNLELSKKGKPGKSYVVNSKKSTSPANETGIEQKTQLISHFEAPQKEMNVLKQAGNTLLGSNVGEMQDLPATSRDEQSLDKPRPRTDFDPSSRRKHEIDAIVQRSKHTMQEDVVDEILSSPPTKETVERMRKKFR